MEGSEFRAWCSEFRVQGLGVQSFGLRGSSSGFGVQFFLPQGRIHKCERLACWVVSLNPQICSCRVGCGV